MSSIEDRVAKHRRMAHAYRDAYKRLGVKDGEKYEEWKFAEDAVFWSPYFTGGRQNAIKLGGMVVDVATYATMEALSYSVKFPDWGPKDFNCWPSDNRSRTGRNGRANVRISNSFPWPSSSLDCVVDNTGRSCLAAVPVRRSRLDSEGIRVAHATSLGRRGARCGMRAI